MWWGNRNRMKILFYFIRHGQTDWNLAHRIQGAKDIPLNETGRKQARMLAEGMKDRPVDSVYTSPLLRARETAQYVADYQGVQVYMVRGLEEINYGEWEGLTMRQVRFFHPIAYRKWWKDPVCGAPPGGESQMDVVKRTAGAMEVVKQHILLSGAEESDKPGKIKAAAVVLHGASLVCLLQWLLRDEGVLEESMAVENTSITTLEWDTDEDRFRLLGINDVRHLGGNE